MHVVLPVLNAWNFKLGKFGFLKLAFQSFCFKGVIRKFRKNCSKTIDKNGVRNWFLMTLAFNPLFLMMMRSWFVIRYISACYECTSLQYLVGTFYKSYKVVFCLRSIVTFCKKKWWNKIQTMDPVDKWRVSLGHKR